MLSRLIGLPWWVYAGTAAVALSGAAYGGWQVRDWQCDAATARAAVARSEAVIEGIKQADTAAADYAADSASGDAIARTTQTTIIREYHNVPTPAEPCFPAPVVDSLRAQREALNASNPGEPAPRVPADPATP